MVSQLIIRSCRKRFIPQLQRTRNSRCFCSSSPHVLEIEKGAKGGSRRDSLLEMQNETQQLWDKTKAFESNPDPSREKYFCTFPYPYMNGFLHIGHAFTLCKAEFMAGYQRLKGKNVIFPFSFHCTGMPIAAAAKKLKREREQFGFPPVFPVEEETKAVQQSGGKKGKKKKKGKAAKKKSKKKYQWQIMKEFGLKDEEIATFAEPVTWLYHFPGICLEHLKKFGLKADFRRSFITTDVNPYYDAFIRWQFTKLEERKHLFFGNRPSVFSTDTNQVCADHDRAEGEQIGPQNYTLIKMQVLNKTTPFCEEKGFDKLEDILNGDKPLFLVAGTLRPETMYGQTNCFVLPSGKYIIVETKDGELWATCAEAARNMSWQCMLAGEKGEIPTVAEITGWDLLGRAVKAPMSAYDHVYVLPLLTIKEDKATGIVTSVPSDAPADYAALEDMKKNDKERKKYYITKEMVDPFEVVEIIEIPPTDAHPQLGRQSAVSLCKAFKVKNQKQVDKIDEIKEIVYKQGFANGKMIVGSHAGMTVKEAKDVIKDELIAAGHAADYWETESKVIARTGDRCVVTFTDQWFLKYGEENWKGQVAGHLPNMEFYSSRTRSEFERIVDWLSEWACSREFGLGTRLPCDKQYVIESLSDSTIYMAYYTIAHHLQGNCDFDGSKSEIPVEWLTNEVFDYIFQDGPLPNTPFPEEKLNQMKAEFNYWYPLDLRVSGKDLIGNHLTMSIYNHAAIWPNNPEKWPRSYFTNGHAMINSEKMSKSTGNFLTLEDGINEFSADCTRFALADAGDGLEDANFSSSVANNAILGLTKEDIWMTEKWEELDTVCRTGDYNSLDRMFDNAMSQCIIASDKAYSKMKFKDALRSSWYNLQKARDFWVFNSDSWHKDLVERFIRVQIVLMAPICPHWSEHMWQKFKLGGLVIDAPFPTPGDFDFTAYQQYLFLRELRHDYIKSYNQKDLTRKKKEKKEKSTIPPYNACYMYVANEYYDYQKMVLTTLEKYYDPDTNEINKDFRKVLKNAVDKKDVKKVFDFATMIDKNVVPEKGSESFCLTTPFDEVAVCKENMELIFAEVKNVPLQNIHIYDVNDPNIVDPRGVASKALPGTPYLMFYLDENSF